MEIELGLQVQDKITGFNGVVTGRCIYISGCDQFLVQPKVDKDGSAREGKWIDVQRLEVLAGEKITLDNSGAPGCDTPAPVK